MRHTCAQVKRKTRKGDIIVDQDEYIRHGATMEAMQKLRPAFAKEGSVTAANASGLNDGAAATLLMSADEAEKRGIEPLARIASYATAGLDPSIGIATLCIGGGMGVALCVER